MVMMLTMQMDTKGSRGLQSTQPLAIWASDAPAQHFELACFEDDEDFDGADNDNDFEDGDNGDDFEDDDYGDGEAAFEDMHSTLNYCHESTFSKDSFSKPLPPALNASDSKALS